MAAKQIFNGTPDNGYCVVDNSAAPAFPTLSAGTHIGYDTILVGATSQSGNPLGVEVNSSWPDFVEDQTAVLTNPLSATIRYSNPS